MYLPATLRLTLVVPENFGALTEQRYTPSSSGFTFLSSREALPTDIASENSWALFLNCVFCPWSWAALFLYS